KFKNTELSDYQGIGNAASAGFGSYIKQVGTAYREFFSPSPWEPTTMYFGFGRIIYYACILLFLIFTIRITAGIVLSAEKNIARSILFPVFSMLFPLAANSIFVLCASSPDTVHSLMMYGEVGFFLWLLLLSDESFAQGSTKKKAVNGDSIAALCGCVLIASLTVSDWYVAGVCYHKADYAIKSSSAFLNRMVMRFETTPGYSEAKGIVFVGRPQPSPTNYAYGEFDNLIGTYPYGLVPYNYLAPVFDYNWKEFLKSEVGFGLPEYDISEIDQSLLNGLNIYPEEGSVAVKDGLILIRFE
ncbi:MAG: hypothetical protein ILP13_09795, partial [Lachnospiraceae bacterium]|nr:hypothetical protein [Lachnospiraceae bacterium]